MHYSKLGSSELLVSRVCLGSMTWGLQNDQQQANAQIDAALAKGIRRSITRPVNHIIVIHERAHHPRKRETEDAETLRKIIVINIIRATIHDNNGGRDTKDYLPPLISIVTQLAVVRRGRINISQDTILSRNTCISTN